MLCKELVSAVSYLDALREKTDDGLPEDFGDLGVACERHTVFLPKAGGGHVRLEVLKLHYSDGKNWHSCTFPMNVETMDPISVS